MAETLVIDGSQGEGGGQVLRTSLSLSRATGRPVRIDGIRAGRKKAGLLRQHLTAVEAAVAIGGAEVDGAELRSKRLEFRPGPVTPGDYHFSVGTAGSACLVLQTVLPPLLTADAPSKITVEGGTHNPFAPTFHFLEHVYLPRIVEMGPRCDAKLHTHGFFPAGEGSFTVTVRPTPILEPIRILARGEIARRHARALVSRLPDDIADRELAIVEKKLRWREEECEIVLVRDSKGPGNIVDLEVRFESGAEVVTGFGEKKVRAEHVASQAAEEMKRFLRSGVPVGAHLADQLLVPMALAGAGAFRTMPLTTHTRTNIDVIRAFLPVTIDTERENAGTVLVTVREEGK